MKTEKTSLIGNYEIINRIGTGTTCKVKLAQKIGTNNFYAIKIFKKSNFEQKPDLQMRIKREIGLMRLLDHPHLLKLEEIVESSRHLYLVIEYAENDELFDYLIKKKALSEYEAISFFKEMIYAIEYLHMNGICHRDLKPENILLNHSNHIKIADFGFAKWMKNNIVGTSCGSPHYISPEIIKGIPYDGRLSDIWSLGVILYTLVAVCKNKVFFF